MYVFDGVIWFDQNWVLGFSIVVFIVCFVVWIIFVIIGIQF